MSLLVKRNASTLPDLVSNFFDTDVLLAPNLINLNRGFLGNLDANIPSVNITEDEKNYKFDLAAPGLEKKDFKVETDHQTLTISSEKENEHKEENENYRRREFSYSSFRRSFDLPENSNPEKIDATYENGILKLKLPKKEITIMNPKKEIKIS